MNLFWVNWVANSSFDSVVMSKGERGAYVSGYSEPCLSLEKAIEIAEFKESKMEIVMVWIEEHDANGKKLGIPYMKILADAFGYRKCGKELKSEQIKED